jgi:hypothetical protein
VNVNPCNGGNFQRWTVFQSGLGMVFIDVSTGFCLDSNTSGAVYTHSCNPGNFQRWTLRLAF